MGQVGAVFALEVSRLSRSNLDWHRLLELCALTDTLVIDEDGCYNPADFNDGLLLGLKGDGSGRTAFVARPPPRRQAPQSPERRVTFSPSGGLLLRRGKPYRPGPR